jgi:HSP90 family molecular chaperone
MSPIIEKLKKNGYEVFFMIEPLDEICAQSMKQFKDFDIVDAAKEGLQLDEDLEGDEESQ